MFKKIMGIVVLIAVMFLGNAAPNRCVANVTLKFDSEIELREAAPNFYYFDFNLSEMELLSARVFTKGRPKNGVYNYAWYEIAYSFISAEFGEINLNINLSSENLDKEAIEYDSIEDIDGLECFLSYTPVTEEEQYKSVSLSFEIESKLYRISIGRAITDEQLQKFVDYFLEIVKPTIETRSKQM